MARVDLVGRRFGRLLVMSKASPRRDGKHRWNCACDCGEVAAKSGDQLLRGITTSCGCYRKEVAGKRRTTHGEAAKGKWSAEYGTWASMLQRCTDPNCRSFKDYGGRGITVCSEWQDFARFLKDMGRKPDASYMIERKNNELGYAPDNCKWATRTEQNSNKRSTRLIEYAGHRLTLVQWSQRTGIAYTTLYARGWPAAQVLTAQVRRKSGEAASE